MQSLSKSCAARAAVLAGWPADTGQLEIRERIGGIRKSHENPAVQQLYRVILEKPLRHKSYELLHTQYTKRDKYKIF